MPYVTTLATPKSSKIVSTAATGVLDSRDIVAGMVTRRRAPARKPQVRRIKLYLREWRKFMDGVSAVDCAIALDIERESYLRLEREPWRITVSELDLIAGVIGVKASQLRSAPPENGQPARESLDDLIEDAPENVRQMAIAAIRGMVGK